MYWKSAVWRTHQTSKNKFLFIGHNILHMFDSLMHHLLFNWLHNRAFADVDALLTVECVQAVMCIIRYRSYLVKGYSWKSGLSGPIRYEHAELFSVTRIVMGHHTYPCCVPLWSTSHGTHLVSLLDIKALFSPHPINAKKTSHRMFRHMHGVLNEAYLQNFLHRWAVNRETNLMSILNPWFVIVMLQ